jgi:hypothetical protein
LDGSKLKNNKHSKNSINNKKPAAKNGSAKKQNGHAKQTNKTTPSTTPVKRKPGRPFKNDKGKAASENETKPVEVLNELHVMRVNFNDREARKRFLHYYKAAKVSDSKVNEQWFVYNNRILEQHKGKVTIASQGSSDADRQRLNDSRELNNHILTTFSTGQEIKNLKKLFYGSEFYGQLGSAKPGENGVSGVAVEQNMLPKKELGMTTSLKRKINEEFVNRHRTFESGKNCVYKDHLVDEEEKIFKIVSERNTELVQRCIALSTIFRNLSFVPGNEQELCKFKLFLRLLARLLVFKHNHKIVLASEEGETPVDEGMS